MAFTAKDVQALREKTGVGMMDCKKALVASDGDMDKAIDFLREKGLAAATKKASRIAAEGVVLAYYDEAAKVGVVIEVNSETDFVAKNDKFLELLSTAAETIVASDAATVEEALALATAEGTLNDTFVNAVATIGEKITLRRFEILTKGDDEFFGAYTHQGGRIVAVTVVKGGDAQVAKNMAMQVASMNPSYISRNYMPQEVVDHEREVQVALLEKDEKLASKPEKVKAGIIEGRISKSLQDMCLVDQEYFLDSDQKCGQYLKANGAEVVKFVKYVVGEGIEKKDDNFAAEVAAMVK